MQAELQRGLAEVQSVTNVPLPPAGIFDPPYAINVNLTQVPIGTKVKSNSHASLSEGCLAAHCSVQELYGLDFSHGPTICLVPPSADFTSSAEDNFA